jgi:hypothetical protein
MTDDAQSRIEQAVTLLKAQQRTEAYAILRPVLKSQPQNLQAWWLAANAAPTPEAAIQASLKVLELKPDHAEAQQLVDSQQKLITETTAQLNEISSLVKQDQKPQAHSLVKTVLEAQPYNVRALWLAANSAPIATQALDFGKRLLDIEPTNRTVQEFMAVQRKLAKQPLPTGPLKEAKDIKRKRRPILLLGLVGLLVMSFAGFGVYVNLTGNTYGLPIGSFFNTKEDAGVLTTKPVKKVGTLVEGGTREYYFVGRPNTLLLVLVQFTSGKGNPAKSVVLRGPDGKIVALPTTTDKGSAIYQAPLTASGTYRMILTGTRDVAQGPYLVQFTIQPLENMPDMSQFQNPEFETGNP